MKKVVVIIVSILLVIALIIGGIFLFKGNNNEDNVGTLGSETEKDSGTKNENKNEGNKKEKYQKFDELPRTLEINSTVKYCVDTPDSVASRAGGGYIVDVDDYFVIYGHYVDPSSEVEFGIKLSNIQTSSVLEEMAEQFLWTSQGGLIWADKYSMNIEAKEEITVNNWDMCRYEGQVLLQSEYTLDYNTADFAAYTVIKDGYPIFFAVFDDPEEDEDVNIGEIADKIAKTFREYEEE